MKPFSIYVHIPYCFHKCPYCDFNTYAVSSFPERDYTAALLAELDYRASLPEWGKRPVQTIYFGGGTPSLFAPSSFRKIIATICKLFPVRDSVEISLEANPGTVTAESLEGYASAGINRISFGAQSFLPDTLKALGRIHTPEQIEAGVVGARAAGITNINIDLIYGVPGQTIADVRSDLREALRLGPTHISAYGLTIEPGTEFFTAMKRGALTLPREEAVVFMMEEINEFLPEQGFGHYEISNFAISGKEAQHNLAYWNGDDYIGLGAGAHSFLRSAHPTESEAGQRWSNFAAPKQYIEQASARGDASSWKDTLSYQGDMFEFFFLGLRKRAGVSAREFESRFGYELEAVFPALMQVLLEKELLTPTQEGVTLSPSGLLVADSVIENFAEPEIKVQPHYNTTDLSKGVSYGSPKRT